MALIVKERFVAVKGPHGKRAQGVMNDRHGSIRFESDSLIVNHHLTVGAGIVWVNVSLDGGIRIASRSPYQHLRSRVKGIGAGSGFPDASSKAFRIDRGNRTDSIHVNLDCGVGFIVVLPEARSVNVAIGCVCAVVTATAKADV